MGKIKQLAKWAIPAAALALPVLTLAATPVTPPDVITGGTPITLREIELRIQQIANFIIAISVVIAAVYIIWGGITWLTVGGDDKKVGTAKERIKNGIIGAAIILAVGVILNTLRVIVARTFFG